MISTLSIDQLDIGIPSVSLSVELHTEIILFVLIPLVNALVFFSCVFVHPIRWLELTGFFKEILLQFQVIVVIIVVYLINIVILKVLELIRLGRDESVSLVA